MKQSPTKQARARVAEFGTNYVSDTDVVATIIGTTNGYAIAERVLDHLDGLIGLSRATVAEIEAAGASHVVATRLRAAFDLNRRVLLMELQRTPLTSPIEAADLMMEAMAGLDHEELRVILLDTKSRIMRVTTLYVGTVNGSSVRIAEVFRLAVKLNASALIVCHNHPSGVVDPSPEDVVLTRQIVEAGKLLEIECVDHIIVGQGRWVSLRERRLGFTE